MISTMTIDPNSDAALKTIDIQQSVIARMAQASATAKNWCVTVVSAFAVVAIDKANWTYALTSIVPVILFCAIDIYYLSLERSARHSHDRFVDQLRDGVATTDSLFDVGTVHLTFRSTVAAGLSKSIWPFYLFTLLALLVVAIAIGNGK